MGLTDRFRGESLPQEARRLKRQCQTVAESEMTLDPREIDRFAIRVYGDGRTGERVEDWAELDEPIDKEEFKEWAEADGVPLGDYKLFAIDEKNRARWCLWSVQAGVEDVQEVDPTEERLRRIEDKLDEGGGHRADRFLYDALAGRVEVDRENVRAVKDAAAAISEIEAAKEGHTSDRKSLAETVENPRDLGEVAGRGMLSLTDDYGSVGEMIEDITSGFVGGAQEAMVGPTADMESEREPAEDSPPADQQAPQPTTISRAKARAVARDPPAYDSAVVEAAREQWPAVFESQAEPTDEPVAQDDNSAPTSAPDDQPPDPVAIPQNATELDQLDFQDKAALAAELGYDGNAYSTAEAELRDWLVAELFDPDGDPDDRDDDQEAGADDADPVTHSEVRASPDVADAATDGGQADE